MQIALAPPDVWEQTELELKVQPKYASCEIDEDE
jgi:hypothetical protein